MATSLNFLSFPTELGYTDVVSFGLESGERIMCFQ